MVEKKEEKKTINEQITDFAKLQFTDGEIAIIAGVSLRDLIKNYAEDVDRGRLMAEAEVRAAILKMAKQGSSPAQKQLMELNAKAKEDSKKARFGR